MVPIVPPVEVLPFRVFVRLTVVLLFVVVLLLAFQPFVLLCPVCLGWGAGDFFNLDLVSKIVHLKNSFCEPFAPVMLTLYTSATGCQYLRLSFYFTVT